MTSKKAFRTAFVVILCLLSSLTLFYCGQQPGQMTAQKPVTIETGQRTGHSEFESAIVGFAAEIAADVAEDGIGSISAGVAIGDDVIWADGFGWADVANRIPADAHTIYRIGSISKSFTAVLMMQMIEDGHFNLDDPVADYLPEFKNLQDKPEGSPAVTFRHLASHTSGLIREPRLEGAAAGPIEGWEDKIMASIPNTYFQTAPEVQYSYSNIGFGILGLTVSRAAGSPFMDLITDHIFKPLGMANSFFILTPEYLPHMSMGYAKRRDGTVDFDHPAIEHAGRGYKVPNGGIYSTVGDLTKFASALTGAASVQIFTEESRREMIKVQTPEGGRGMYGLGFSVSIDDDGFTTMGHGGSVSGYNAYLTFEPESKISVVLLRNYSGGVTNLGRAARGLLKKLVMASDNN